MPDTTYDSSAVDPNFPYAGKRVAWRQYSGQAWRWSHVYEPSADALDWDRPACTTNAAIGSRFGGYVYVELLETGRGKRKSPAGPYGMKARMTFAAGTPDQVTVDAWVITD